MSLTSHLDDRNSPIRQFIEEQFPRVDRVRGTLKEKLAAADTRSPSKPLPYGLVGSALDYRVRYYFAISPWHDLVASHGARLAFPERELFVAKRADIQREGADSTTSRLSGANKSPLHSGRVADYVASLESDLELLQPVGRRLERSEEVRLCQHCFVLGLFEQVFRAGRARCLSSSPLFVPDPKTTTAELLAIAQEHWLEDLCALSWDFHDTCAELLSQGAVLNPTFDGSADVGGADADLIVDGCLIEVKATVDPSRHWREWLHQLMGYVLLDYDDRYCIQHIGIYLARQRLLLRWPIHDIMNLLSEGALPALEQLRGNFQRIASAGRESYL